ncbi:cytochrome C biogenesis protein [Sphingosinicellaceae bacterium]|nr:cytochrome C biogenesis protein [Sphingosinicellaceae bacterium]
MIAVLIALGFAATVALLLLRGQSDGRMRVAVAVALVVALGGFAFSGRPFLPASPPASIRPDLAATSAFEAERQERLQRFGEIGAWLTFADALIRADAAYTAVQGLRGALDRHPNSADLWIGLGNALAVHGGGVGSASRLAFDRAAMLAPASPEPAFFRGLAELETGDARRAARTWRALAARSLPDPDVDRWTAIAEQRAVGQP